MNFCWLGYITSKDALPVTKLNFGRTLTTSSYGIHTLGKLECSGRATVDRMAESCDDLWKIGHTLNGFYDVKGDKQVRSVYCDFTKLWTSSCFHFIHFWLTGMETAVGVVDVKSSPVYFHVQRNSTYTLNGTTIPFQIERMNVGGGMNITSGIFTAPKSGIYFFAFIAIKDWLVDVVLDVDLYHNSNRITRAFGNSAANGHFTVALTSTLSMNSGDQISLQLVRGPMYDSWAYHTNFNGMLLQEEMFSWFKHPTWSLAALLNVSVSLFPASNCHCPDRCQITRHRHYIQITVNRLFNTQWSVWPN